MQQHHTRVHLLKVADRHIAIYKHPLTPQVHLSTSNPCCKWTPHTFSAPTELVKQLQASVKLPCQAFHRLLRQLRNYPPSANTTFPITTYSTALHNPSENSLSLHHQSKMLRSSDPRDSSPSNTSQVVGNPEKGSSCKDLELIREDSKLHWARVWQPQGDAAARQRHLLLSW